MVQYPRALALAVLLPGAAFAYLGDWIIGSALLLLHAGAIALMVTGFLERDAGTFFGGVGGWLVISIFAVVHVIKTFAPPNEHEKDS